MRLRTSLSVLLLTATLTALIIVSPRLTVKAQTGPGGPLSGLSQAELDLFSAGLKSFGKKWDPCHGLGPVFTQAGCFSCHAGGGISTANGVPGQTSLVLGTRYGKWNSDGTFNYLDGTGTFPENEGGPV